MPTYTSPVAYNPSQSGVVPADHLNQPQDPGPRSFAAGCPGDQGDFLSQDCGSLSFGSAIGRLRESPNEAGWAQLPGLVHWPAANPSAVLPDDPDVNTVVVNGTVHGCVISLPN